MMRLQAALCLTIVLTVAPSTTAIADDACGTVLNPVCSSVAADRVQGEFHGLIAVKGQRDVLQTAAHSGTAAGCGDCVWTLVMMCLANTPNDPHNQQPCVGAARSLKCRPGQTAFRLYLTTAAVTNELVETLCLGGLDD